MTPDKTTTKQAEQWWNDLDEDTKIEVYEDYLRGF